MDISKVDLVRCKIDCELKKNDKDNYVGLAKGLVGNDGIESIFYLEMDKEAYSYIAGYDLNNTFFDISGILQARKNKNGVPFIYYKVVSVVKAEDKEKLCNMNEEDIASVGESEKDLGDKLNSKKKTKAINKVIPVTEVVESLGLKFIMMSADKITLTEKEHLKKAFVDLNRNLDSVIIRPLEESSDEYSLVLGYSAFVKAKLLNTQLKAYIIDKSRDEIVNCMKVIRKNKSNEKREV